ncbi:ABC transporter ATP-binding protein [Actinobacteria bacterium YIM 96077]|uniref:ABC transporter ATP-binding protein n=1 Tax=Phytoactinopolyspora halophila TaxID=1981511 RepID=A0A329QQX8_9ACTN|nr:ABC transporter ATP-binding protein [Phytoactinopolyspora halophila]AYY14225.1 ABC transporter ATP-binding protein [Actinobacteria bacterium YIM 96077]RAW14767.1 ABC transporter ATP-binding protein [Phytoactinopolyspora halophila]
MISGTGIVKTFRQRGDVLGKNEVKALRGVDFTIPEGGAISFIGESGCGKTTLGRIIAGLETHDEGEITIGGVAMSSLRTRAQQPHFRRIQLIHQDPYSALNPTRTVHQALHDPLKLRARETGRSSQWIYERAEELLGLVGLDPGYVLPRYPHQLSGGMRQRVVIARALTVDPDVLVADEAVSMIDVSLRLGILRLLRDLREQLGVSLLYITHDVATARYIGADGDMYVIYRGQVVESGPTETIINQPVHPYTQSLLSAIPVLYGVEQPGAEQVTPIDSLTTAAVGETVDDAGCLFAPRCPFRTERCTRERPVLGDAVPALQDAEGRVHACFHPIERQVAATSVQAP